MLVLPQEFLDKQINCRIKLGLFTQIPTGSVGHVLKSFVQKLALVQPQYFTPNSVGNVIHVLHQTSNYLYIRMRIPILEDVPT